MKEEEMNIFCLFGDATREELTSKQEDLVLARENE